MYTLGINATFHDSAACLVHDGFPVAAAEEERFSRVKHAKRPTPYATYQLPFGAIDYCLREADISLAQVDQIAYSFDPQLLLGQAGAKSVELIIDPRSPTPPSSPWETIFPAAIASAPRLLVDDVPFHLKERFQGLKPIPAERFHFVEHHLAHAASAFLASPFERAAIMTLDGRGELATTLLALGQGTDIVKLKEITMPHSLGLLYEALTEHLGFLRCGDEYKVMALASYGQPCYQRQFADLVSLEEGGFSIRPVDLSEVLGPPRQPGAPLERRHFDIAASLQRTTEDVALHLASWLHRQTGASNLCLAGGVALNCVMNSHLRRRSPFRDIFVQPAASDAGTALGAALWIDATCGRGQRRYQMTHAYLGPAYDDQRIQTTLHHARLPYERPRDLARAVARAIADGQIVGWFQGRMEFGPRALGARSILATPTDPTMVQRLNDLKDREDFRPVAPAVLEEAAEDYFENAAVSPFMLFTFPVRSDKADEVPAIRHVDGSARVQTVSRATSPLLHRLIAEFASISGVPMVINTSFNTRGQPIVCSPEDAIACFYTSPIDVLAIGSFMLRKPRRRYVINPTRSRY